MTGEKKKMVSIILIVFFFMHRGYLTTFFFKYWYIERKSQFYSTWACGFEEHSTNHIFVQIIL